MTVSPDDTAEMQSIPPHRPVEPTYTQQEGAE
jgi:hypothetical protein